MQDLEKKELDNKTLLRELKDGKYKDVKFVKLCFPDITGNLTGFEVPSEDMEEVLENGQGFDGSSIEGLVRIEESDLMAFPEARTFRVLPWESSCNGETFKVGIIFCDIRNPDLSHNEGDTRYVLKKALERAKKMGFSDFFVGPELEFFLFKELDGGIPKLLDKGGYFTTGINDPNSAFRMEVMRALKKMGIKAEYAHHEVAPSQHEIDLRYQNAIDMADTVMLLKLVIKEVASRHGLYATFMPKVLNGVNGSGMHIHQSLAYAKPKNGYKNAFFDPSTNHSLSDVAEFYMAGLMRRIKEVTAVTNPTVNSFKRLVPGFEAPVYIVWGTRNRSALIRVPEYRPGEESARKMELRSPNPSGNPYLAFAVILEAGLEGIENKEQLKVHFESDAYKLSQEERKAMSIDSLPESPEEVIKLAKESELLKKALGEHVFRNFIANWEKLVYTYRWEVPHKYDKEVSEWEVKEYLPLL